MSTRKLSSTTTVCLVAILALGGGSYGEKPQPAVVAGDKEKKEFGPEIEHPFGDKPVKGAPFSAQVIIENTQTLAGGINISRKKTGALYRDSEGRTRQEQPRDGAPEVVLINDPVAGALYNLYMFRHMVRKVAYQAMQQNGELEKRKHREMEERAQQERGAEEAARQASVERGGKEVEPEKKTESLGSQMLEGVQAVGTRFTVTIPAGWEGNDRPFDIVSERWYSPELRMVVMSKRSDPRSGDNVYRLTNINLSEPPHSLFEVPPGFTITEEKTEGPQEKIRAAKRNHN